MISLKEDHLSSPEPLVDEAVGVGRLTAQEAGPPSEKWKGHFCRAGAGRRPSAGAANSHPRLLSSTPLNPTPVAGPTGGPELQRKGEGRKKIANSIVGNQPYGAG